MVVFGERLDHDDHLNERGLRWWHWFVWRRNPGDRQTLSKQFGPRCARIIDNHLKCWRVDTQSQTRAADYFRPLGMPSTFERIIDGAIAAAVKHIARFLHPSQKVMNLGNRSRMQCKRANPYWLLSILSEVLHGSPDMQNAFRQKSQAQSSKATASTWNHQEWSGHGKIDDAFHCRGFKELSDLLDFALGAWMSDWHFVVEGDLFSECHTEVYDVRYRSMTISFVTRQEHGLLAKFPPQWEELEAPKVTFILTIWRIVHV